MLEGAKEQELSYEGRSSIKLPTDRLLRSKSLEIGLQKSSKKRCAEIREEYPDRSRLFDDLKEKSAFLEKEQLQQVWQDSASNKKESFEEFVSFMSEIGIIQWQTKGGKGRYKFADIYVYGFEMERKGAP